VNEWLTHEVVARDLFARLPLITDAEAWVAFPGGVGTLQEVALCWNLVQNGLADPRPLIVVGDRWKRLEGSFRDILIVSDPAHLELVTQVSTAEEALAVVRKELA
jgi:predicted Rossmann-fold nucleotide-binding protein